MPQDQWTPLHSSAFHGRAGAAALLLAAKADPAAADEVCGSKC